MAGLWERIQWAEAICR